MEFNNNNSQEAIPETWETCKIILPLGLAPDLREIAVGMADMMILGTKAVDLTVNSNQSDPEQNAKLSELIEKLKSAAPSMEVIFT